MRVSALVPLFLCVVAVGALGCPNEFEEVCGVSAEPPTEDEVADGFGRAARSDGGALEARGTFTPNNLLIGTLDFAMQFEETGLLVETLIGDGAFPICVPLGAQSERSGRANLVDEGLVSDETHTGGLALLGLEDGLLIGRFEVDMTGAGGELSLTDGVFRLPRR